MKTITVNLFKFDELSDGAQRTVIDRECYEIQEDAMDSTRNLPFPPKFNH